MNALDTAASLERFGGRGAGTDAERRAANWLAAQLCATARSPRIETFWCRPNTALAHAWHVALALAGSLISVASPRVGAALILAAIAFVIVDSITGFSPGRRLTPERASQNVVASAPGTDEPAAASPLAATRVRLILTANYDAGRTGLAHRPALRRPPARLRRALRGVTLGWLGWLVLALAWLEATAILRVRGDGGTSVGALQLPPTIAMVLALALLLELASSPWSPAGGENGSGVGTVLAVARALDAAPPTNLDVELVLAGAGDPGDLGLAHHIRSHRLARERACTVVIGVGACSEGQLRWWQSDGPLFPLRYGARLRRLAEGLAEEPGPRARRHDGRGHSPALPARLARIPAIAIGCLDRDGLVPRSHSQQDLTRAANPAASEQAVQFLLMLVDAIDTALSARRALTPA